MKSVIIENITKKYEEVTALDVVNCTVEKGELFGFVGPDGAGKTTLFRILTTLLVPEGGKATVEGWDVVKDYKKIRASVGYMPGKFSLYQDLSIEENLHFFATIFGTTVKDNIDLVWDIYEQIEPFKKRKAGKLSGGMKQKLALCCALIHKPLVLFLDEPTTGVDPVSRKEFWEMLKKLKASGITILVSTPYMDEANLCDRVALVKDGHFMQIDAPAKIVSEFGRPIYAIQSDNMYALIKDLRALEQAHSVYPFGEYLHYTDERESVDEQTLRAYLQSKNHQNIDIQLIDPNIEDCFMELMQQAG
ncbi:MAG TPA: ATPase [Microscillaceae bacterium]|nr:ATPase [Microscillaceae bacterium]